jgi:hypothetical protein
VFLVLLFPSLFRFVLVGFGGLCNLLLEGGEAVIACGMHCARVGRFNAAEKEVVFVAAVSAAEEARAVIGVWVVESEQQTVFLVMWFECPMKLGECFVYFVDQILGLAERNESYCFACLVTPSVVAGCSQ